LARPDDVVRDLNGFSAVPLAVDHCSGGRRNAGDLRQRKRTETHQHLLGTSGLSQGEKQNGDKGAGSR
jgi:hypothetical protein